jgi:NCAIR mutase (PurE)-related protein
MWAVDLGSVRSLLARVAAGDLPVEEAMGQLAHMTFVDLGDLKPDVLREVRTGQAEAVFGPGKTPDQVGAAVAALVRESAGAVFVTRATAEQYEAARRVDGEAVYYPRCGLVVVRSADGAPTGRVAVVSAGTSDLPVADEASLTAEALGMKVERVTDVGVAGVHRALAHRPALEEADCVLVVAGMEGALPSLVAGLVSSPVVAVPTSVGYGATFGGLAALLAMLSSCVPGVVVVNVDNGFGAALAAHRIVRR